jgi:hypothetical protein
MTQSPRKKPIRKLDRKNSNPEDQASVVRAQEESTDAETAEQLEQQLAIMQIDQETADRIRKLPKDVGWLLLMAGVLGLLVPGVIGTPFFVLGSFMVWPPSRGKAERWLSGQSPKAFKGSMKQINRFLDDLERRYPT